MDVIFHEWKKRVIAKDKVLIRRKPKSAPCYKSGAYSISRKTLTSTDGLFFREKFDQHYYLIVPQKYLIDIGRGNDYLLSRDFTLEANNDQLI